jgi:lysophospholipase L1-like esterase
MPTSRARKLLYSAVTTALFLLLLEGVLALLPLAYRTEPASLPPSTQISGTIVCVGDSVTAGVGVPSGQAWPDHLGLSLQRHGISLLREALPGAGIDFARTTPLARIEAMADDAAPTVLVMLGHNDLVRWAPGSRHRFARFVREADPEAGSPGGEAARWQGPRVWRAARWAWLVASGSGPQVDPIEQQALTRHMVEAFTPLRDAAEARGGRLVLLTYLVPGQPPEALDAQAQAVVAASREAQLLVNRAIRATATELGVPVIDLETAGIVGAVWSPAGFVDHIHPSAKSSARAAAIVYAWFVSSP